MKLSFSGSTLSWSHHGPVLAICVHPTPGRPAVAEGPLVEWEAVARYLTAGADGARGLVVHGAEVTAIDAGVCWPSIRDRARWSWERFPRLVASLGAAGELARASDRIAEVWRTVGRFGSSIAVVGGSCRRGGRELVGAVDRVVAERWPGTDERLSAAGIAVDRWAEPGSGLEVALEAVREPNLDQRPLVGGAVQASRQSR